MQDTPLPQSSAFIIVTCSVLQESVVCTKTSSKYLGIG